MFVSVSVKGQDHIPHYLLQWLDHMRVNDPERVGLGKKSVHCSKTENVGSLSTGVSFGLSCGRFLTLGLASGQYRETKTNHNLPAVALALDCPSTPSTSLLEVSDDSNEWCEDLLDAEQVLEQPTNCENVYHK